jgi:hypothetical protein
VVLLQKIILLGRVSMSLRIVDPVAVYPEVVSKKAKEI